MKTSINVLSVIFHTLYNVILLLKHAGFEVYLCVIAAAALMIAFI